MIIESNIPEPVIETKRAMRIAGFGRVFNWSEMGEIPMLWGKAGPWIESLPNAVHVESFGAMFIPEPGKGDLGYLAGIAVPAAFQSGNGLMTLALPATRFAIFPHNGGLSEWPKTIDCAQQVWLPQSGFQQIELVPGAIPVMERYGPGFDPEAGVGDMQCWLSIT